MAHAQGAKSSLVYHYTTAEGLKGIIENHCVWATNVNFLNDISEYHHGVNVIREEIEKYEVEPEKLLTAKIEPTAVARWNAKGLIISNVQQKLKEADYSLWTFVTSFFDSTATLTKATLPDAGDILEQWRAYSRDAAGFSIGFDKFALEKHLSGSDYGVTGLWTTAGRCTYELEQKKRKVKRIIESLEPVLPTFLQGDLNELWNWTARAFETSSAVTQSRRSEHTQEIIDAAMKKLRRSKNFEALNNKLTEVLPHFMGELMVQPALMKDQAFRGEKEWRLVTLSFDPSKVLLRTSKSGLIPYLEIPISDPEDPSRLGRGLIKRIVVGPLGLASERESDNAISAVKMLLQKNKVPIKDAGSSEGVFVQSSRIPFRR